MKTKQVIVSNYGPAEVLKIKDVNISDPQANQVMIQNKYISVDYTDIYWRTGQLDAPEVPLTPGKAGAGIITKAGANVTRFNPGDRVAYIQAPGAYAEFFNAPAKMVVKLPDDISFCEAAAIMMKGLTADALIKHVYPVDRNKTIFIHAMAGGVGSFLTAWGKSLGATVIGSIGNDAKAVYAQKLGADKVINYHHEDISEMVNTFTGQKGVDVVYDGIGKATVNASLEMLKHLGLYVNFGQVSGPITNFTLGTLAAKTQYVTFANVNTFVDDLGMLQQMSNELFTFYVNANFKDEQEITEFDFDDVVEAHKLLESGRSQGSIVMRV